MKNILKSWIFCLSLVVLLSACVEMDRVARDLNDSLPPIQRQANPSSCMLAALGECIDYIDSNWSVDQARRSCIAVSRSRLSSMAFQPNEACPSTSKVHACDRLDKGAKKWVRNTLYAPQFSEGRARSACSRSSR